MRGGRKFLIVYLVVLGVLSLISAIPGVALSLTVLTLPLLGVPGLVTMAAPTILLYSLGLVPLWLALTGPRLRIELIAASALLPFVIAVVPSELSRRQAAEFTARMSKDDMRREAPSMQPKRIELIGDRSSGLFTSDDVVGNTNAACNEICRRLLFNSEAQWVRMTLVPDPERNKRSGKTTSVTYRIERRTSCPQAFPEGGRLKTAVRDRLVAGDCLIAEAGHSEPADAVMSFTTRYSSRQYPRTEPDQGPALATVESVKDLRIDVRQDNALAPVVKKTETVTLAVARPLYIAPRLNLGGGDNGSAIGRVSVATETIDPARALRATFGFKLAEISPPPPENPRSVAERILALPAELVPSLSTQQQGAITDVLTEIAKQPALTDADIDFVRLVIADGRLSNPQAGTPIANMFRKSAVPLEPLIPIVLERIGAATPQSSNYRSMLGWSLMSYSGETLRPYRDKMIAIAEAQTDFSSYGVLTRLAELGSEDGVNLVIRRLDSGGVRQFAAIAACRASADAWPALEPAVLAHLAAPKRRDSLDDEEGPLMLALVRNGKKSVVTDMIESRDLHNKRNALLQLAKFEAGFGPERCRQFRG